MLIKMMLDPRDYQRSLRRRRWVATGLLCVGVVGLVCYFLLVSGSSLSDYARGFYLGAASGIFAGALVLLVRAQYLLTHPEAQKRAKIQETDERQLHITGAAMQFAGMATFFVSAAALFVVLPFSIAAFSALLGAMALYCLLFVAASLWLSKRL